MRIFFLNENAYFKGDVRKSERILESFITLHCPLIFVILLHHAARRK